MTACKGLPSLGMLVDLDSFDIKRVMVYSSAGWQAFGEIGGWLALCAYKQQRRLSVEITDCEKYRTVACAFGDEYATKDAFFWPASS